MFKEPLDVVTGNGELRWFGAFTMTLHTIECLNFLSTAFELHEASGVFAINLIYISLTLLTGISAVIPAMNIRRNKSLFHIEYTIFTDE